MAKKASIHDLYFLWLVELAQVPGGRTYVELCAYLHNRWEFRWSVDYDENRQADGFDLRELYVHHHPRTRRNDIRLLMEEPVSMLEVLIGIAKRLDFQLYDPEISSSGINYRFDELIINLELNDLDDSTDWSSGRPGRKVDDVMEVLLDRTYDADGNGSLFPLSENSHKVDMREVEIWYQMMEYMAEKYP